MGWEVLEAAAEAVEAAMVVAAAAQAAETAARGRLSKRSGCNIAA